MIKRVLLNRPHVIIISMIPVNTSVPTITGTAQVGQTLTAGNGSWTNSPTSYTYQWSDTSTGNIAGATAQTYAPTSANVGHTLRVAVVAINGAGSSLPALSAASAFVSGTGPGVLDFSQAADSALLVVIVA